MCSAQANPDRAAPIHLLLCMFLELVHVQMIHMGCFDTDGDGAVTDTELQAYIAALVPELPGLQNIDRSMAVDTYAQIAARKFLFFLGKKGK